MEHRLVVANSPWSDGTCEWMMGEVVCAGKAIMQEDVVPVLQWALNTAYRERYASTPYHVMLGRAPLTSFSTLASSTGKDGKVDALDGEALRRKVANVVEAHQGMHKVVDDRVKKNRERQRQAASRGQLLNFAVGDYVMVARVRRLGSTPMLVSTWTGSCRIVMVDKVHVNDVQGFVTGEVKDEHVVRLRFYADKNMEMTAALKKVLQHAFSQGESEMAGIVDILEAEDGQGFYVKMGWVGFVGGESTWEPLATTWNGAQQFVQSELRKLRLDRGARLRLQTFNGITLKIIGAYFTIKLVWSTLW